MKGMRRDAMKKIDVVCIGIVLLDLPIGPLDSTVFSRETTMVKDINLTTGGDALNESIVLSRLGQKVALIGHIGKDFQGEYIIGCCNAEGIDISGLNIDPMISTRTNIVLFDEDGQRHFVKTKGAASRPFSIEEIDEALIASAEAMSLASIFASKLRDTDVIHHCLKIARQNQTITFADMVPMTEGESLDDLKKSLPLIDYLLPNLEEAAMLTGLCKPNEIIRCLLDYGVGTVVLKAGSEGCLIGNQNHIHHIPSYPADVIDTTGAGDNFSAAFICGKLRGLNHHQCGDFANAVAALSTQQIGATTARISLEQVYQYQRAHRNR